jgi:hypothetical protein
MSLRKILRLCPPALLACVLIASSCNKACQAGYVNPNCSVEVRAQFENLYYTATEERNQDTPAYTYSATIIASPRNPLGVLMGNVANGFFVNYVYASTSNDTLTIPYQAPDTNGRYIQGLGIISGSVLTLSYAVTYPDSTPVIHSQTDYYYSSWVHP